MFCEPPNRGTSEPQASIAEFISSNAFVLGAYDHPRFMDELITAATRAYDRFKTVIPLRNDAMRSALPMLPFNSMSIGPRVDVFMSQLLCGSFTMDNERLLKDL